MSNDEVLAEVRKILAEVLEGDVQNATPETPFKDIEKLDSFGMITMFLAVEGAFGVRFTTDELSAMLTIGDLVAGIGDRLRQRPPSEGA